MKKICVITGTRAEYGLLRPLIDRVYNDASFKLQLIVTGMHLSPEFGLTYKQIEKDGYVISEKVEILLSSDTPVGISKSVGLGTISFSECYERLKPDIIIILGDRYEIFAAASAAMISRIPIVHLHGGETTRGAIDEAIRHSISKMSYLHFTSTDEYRRRVIQLGESPERVFNVGAIGVENIKSMKLLSKIQLEKEINFKIDRKTVLVTYHPVTLEKATSQEQFSNILHALDELKEFKIIFTKANSDHDGRIINKMIDDYAKLNKDRTIVFTSMGQLRYLSSLKYVDAVIGNSSSGIIEAPSFEVPTINIGDRQKGRIQASSVINCRPEKEEILEAFKTIFSREFKNILKDVKNPYGEGNVSERIIKIIKKHLFNELIDIKKTFYDIKMYQD